MFLSKSQYLRGLQCEKSLWLYKYRRELQDVPCDLQLARFDSGNEVGTLALELFNCKDKIDFNKDDFASKIDYTKTYIENAINKIATNYANPNVITNTNATDLNYTYSLAEATFEYNGILVMVDILEITKDGLIINEVKSGTSLKPVYIDDLAIQYFVITNAGYSVIDTNLIHINNFYERKGELELEKLFTKVSCLKEVKAKQCEVEENLIKFECIINNKDNIPHIDIDSYCDNPYTCDFKGFCWREVPMQDSVFNISRLDSKTKFELYHKGIVHFSDIKDFSAFNAQQTLQIKCALNHKIYIDKPLIKSFLDLLRYPIYHLDFESFQEPVPSFDDEHPYAQVPFQYSLHIDYGEGNENKLEHREFLADCNGDPRDALVKSLVRDIPKDSLILAYNASFEKGIMKKLALTFPKYAEILENFCTNTLDLMTPFAQKSYYHYAMNGSHSIKAVLPALVPEMEKAYKNLKLIHNGGEAMEVFPKLKAMSETERESYRTALLEYCKLDTLAMVKVLGKLREVMRNSSVYHAN